MFRSVLIIAILSLVLTTPAFAETGKTEGEIRKIDAETKKITLRHGPVSGELEMPGMTMVFQVKEDHLLHHIQPGDKVEATILKENGIFYIQSIEKK